MSEQSPPPRRRRPWRVVAIVAAAVVGALVVSGAGIGLGAGAAALGRLAGSVIAHQRVAQPGSGSRSGTGAAGPRVGTHHAASPLHCRDDCITTGATQAGVRPDEQSLDDLGTPELSDDGSDAQPATPREDYDDTHDLWTSGDPTGDDCMFTYGVGPVNAADGTPPRADGSSSIFLSEYQSHDEGTVDDQAARVFADSHDAEAYVAGLQARIAACRHYTFTDDESDWDADVFAFTAWPTLPNDVTAIGWVERDTGGNGGFIGVDLQRGDLVVRTTIQGDGLVDDAVSRFIAATAKQLAQLPSDGSAPPNA